MQSTDYDEKDELHKLAMAKGWKLRITKTAYLLVDEQGHEIARYESPDLVDYRVASTYYVDLFKSGDLWDEREFYHELCALANRLPADMYKASGRP